MPQLKNDHDFSQPAQPLFGNGDAETLPDLDFRDGTVSEVLENMFPES